jgi:magnesium chelatase subunit D
MKHFVFPFTAVAGQEKLKRGLLLNLVNPKCAGILIAGQKGSAKSTLARGLASLGEMKVIELPLNATEDRLMGSIDLKEAIGGGRRAFEPGILHAADSNILYVDEVNLLSDHIANALLEAASSGVCRVEREGISLSHPSRFVLIGTMNPEEGKLRPQLLDRFGLFVSVEAETDVSMRTEIMRRRLAFEADPTAFAAEYEQERQKLAIKVAQARERLANVEVTENAMALASAMAERANAAGHRAEILLIEAARANAALEGRKTIAIGDLTIAGEYVLIHRTLESAPSPPQAQAPPPEESPEEPEEETPPDSGEEKGEEGPPPPEEAEAPPEKEEEQPEPENSSQDRSLDAPSGPQEDDVQDPGDMFEIRRWEDPALVHGKLLGNGRRLAAISPAKSGRYVSWRFQRGRLDNDVAFDATMRAAAPFQGMRDRSATALAIEEQDMRIKIREKKTGSVILFAVDASASVGANKRMAAVKAAILSMLAVSYQKRDKVGLIAFRGDKAELVLDVTRSVDLANKRLRDLACGGRTPLASGLALAHSTLMGYRLKDPWAAPTLVLVTDGRANQSDIPGVPPLEAAMRRAERIGSQGIQAIVIDAEMGLIRLKLCERLNEKLKGTLIGLEDLKAEGIVLAVNALKR